MELNQGMLYRATDGSRVRVSCIDGDRVQVQRRDTGEREELSRDEVLNEVAEKIAAYGCPRPRCSFGTENYSEYSKHVAMHQRRERMNRPPLPRVEEAKEGDDYVSVMHHPLMTTSPPWVVRSGTGHVSMHESMREAEEVAEEEAKTNELRLVVYNKPIVTRAGVQDEKVVRRENFSP